MNEFVWKFSNRLQTGRVSHSSIVVSAMLSKQFGKSKQLQSEILHSAHILDNEENLLVRDIS